VSYARISAKRIVPVVGIADLNHAAPVARAISDGGLDIFEIVLRSPVALDAISAACEACPDMFIGAGTVLTCDQVDAAIDAGAKFGVAPGLNERVVRHAQSRDFPFIPGVVTASEIEHAIELGCPLLKFFPAEPAGGAPLLKSVAAPYSHLDLGFVPLGGVKPGNMGNYFAIPSVSAIGGSWIASKDLQLAGDWAQISANVREALVLAAQ
jgi:2-dehydro-3-deoxyphosphogluconate aldolase / (4S)-4-hydroxy-2-oxoglutarate aldolase